MKVFKRYNLLFFTLFFSVALFLSFIGFVNQPLVGDLTRIGGFSENDFGWNNPQTEFESVLFDQAEKLIDYNKYYDVVVLADSFVFLDKERSWLNFFVAQTGLKVLAFHQQFYNIQDVLSSDQFKRTPPRLFIYESVERGIIGNILFQKMEPSAEIIVEEQVKAFPPIQFTPLNSPRESIQRDITRLSYADMVSEASSYTVRLLKRRLFDFSKVEKLSLNSSKGTLFSNKHPWYILVSKKDFDKQSITEDAIVETSLKISQIKRSVEKNHKTEFFLLLIPDKLTVYRDKLKNKIAYSGVIERLAQCLSLLRVDRLLQAEVAAGVKDVYLPNDTHTGSYSNEQVASFLASAIIAKQVPMGAVGADL